MNKKDWIDIWGMALMVSFLIVSFWLIVFLLTDSNRLISLLS